MDKQSAQWLVLSLSLETLGFQPRALEWNAGVLSSIPRKPLLFNKLFTISHTSRGPGVSIVVGPSFKAE